MRLWVRSSSRRRGGDDYDRDMSICYYSFSKSTFVISVVQPSFPGAYSSGYRCQDFVLTEETPASGSYSPPLGMSSAADCAHKSCPES